MRLRIGCQAIFMDINDIHNELWQVSDLKKYGVLHALLYWLISDRNSISHWNVQCIPSLMHTIVALGFFVGQALLLVFPLKLFIQFRYGCFTALGQLFLQDSYFQWSNCLIMNPNISEIYFLNAITLGPFALKLFRNSSGHMIVGYLIKYTGVISRSNILKCDF